MLFLPGLPFKIGSSQRAKHLLTSNKHFLKTKNQAERIVFRFAYLLLYTAFVQFLTIFVFHRNIIVHIIFVSSRYYSTTVDYQKSIRASYNNSCIFKRIFNSSVIVFFDKLTSILFFFFYFGELKTLKRSKLKCSYYFQLKLKRTNDN